MENMTETKARFIRENPRYVFKQEVVATEYLKWLEDLARKQLAYNDALQIVSSSFKCCKEENKCSKQCEDCKMVYNCF
tara:strand:- start:18 stop:251 length:234 start_codon:yes stop_codon:yes gene_type:complete